MKKISSKEVFMLVTLAGFLILAVVYVMVYLKYTNLTTQKETSNANLQKEVNDLKVYFDKMPEYKKQMAEMKEGIGQLIEQYPGDSREEDALLTAVRMQQNGIVNFNTVTIAENEAVHTIPVETVTAAGLEEYTEQIDFCARQVTYNNQTDYNNLKECIKIIYEKKGSVGISNVAYTLDESTGCIEGVIDVLFYSLKGMGREYVKPVIPAYESGTENPFAVKGN